MSKPWFRFYSEALRDRKVEYVCRATGHPKALVIGTWATLLALGNDSPERGALLIAQDMPVTMTDLEIDTGLDRQTLATLLDQFERVQMIARLDGVIILCNWNKRQFASDDVTERVRKHRAAKTKLSQASNVSETQVCNVSETVVGNTPETESDTETDTEQNRERGGATGENPPVGASAPSPAIPSSVPDPSGMTVKEVARLDLDKDGWRTLGKAEFKGKNRAGVEAIVERKLRRAPPAVEVYRETVYAYPARPLWGRIEQAVGEDPDDLDLWHRVIIAWIGNGWNPRNVNGMLDYYARREIPAPTGARGARAVPTSRLERSLAAVQEWRAEA